MPPGLGTEVVTRADFVWFRLRREGSPGPRLGAWDVCLELCKPSGAPSRGTRDSSCPKTQEAPWKQASGPLDPRSQWGRDDEKAQGITARTPRSHCREGAGQHVRPQGGKGKDSPAQLRPFSPPDFISSPGKMRKLLGN